LPASNQQRESSALKERRGKKGFVVVGMSSFVLLGGSGVGAGVTVSRSQRHARGGGGLVGGAARSKSFAAAGLVDANTTTTKRGVSASRRGAVVLTAAASSSQPGSGGGKPVGDGVGGSVRKTTKKTAKTNPAETTANRGGVSGSSGSGSSLNAASAGTGDAFVDAYRVGNAAARSARASGGMPGGSGSSRDEEEDDNDTELTYENNAYNGTSSSGSSSFDSIDDLSEPVPLKINQDLLLYQARAMRNKGMKLRKRDDRQAARLNSIRIFERAMAVDPSDGRAYVGMAQVLRALGDHDAARQCYQDGCDATVGGLHSC
jgi:hypothetical protein